MKNWIMVFVLALTATFAWAGQEGKDKIIIVASTTQVADFARQVAGDDAIVKGILTPGADPHLYKPRPSDLETVKSATLLFQNGLDLEGYGWMERLAKDAGKPLYTATDGVELLKVEEEGKMVPDPHAWFDPKNAAVYVKNIAEKLAKYDPAHADNYKARAALYLQQLRTLNAWIKKELNVVVPEQRILVTAHDALGYFAQAYGFKNVAPVGWSTGSEVGGGMTPERRKQVIASIKQYNVPAVFIETTINPQMVSEIAKEAGVQIGGELYADSMGKKGSAGETYLGMMRENVLKIKHALGPKK